MSLVERLKDLLMFEDNKGLVFIVDISGYSQFIREISPPQGISIIRHLLKGIIKCNFTKTNAFCIVNFHMSRYILGIDTL